MAAESFMFQNQYKQQAKARTGLLLDIDDFTIRKGHRYNTGLHDLHHRTFSDIIPVRTIPDFRTTIKRSRFGRRLIQSLSSSI